MVPLAAGLVVLVRFPFSDLSQIKLRPAVVLAHAGRADWIMCQVTSKSYADLYTGSIALRQGSSWETRARWRLGANPAAGWAGDYFHKSTLARRRRDILPGTRFPTATTVRLRVVSPRRRPWTWILAPLISVTSSMSRRRIRFLSRGSTDGSFQTRGKSVVRESSCSRVSASISTRCFCVC